MSAIDDLAAARRVLDVPGPRDDVVAAGRNRLDDLVRREADVRRVRPRGRRRWIQAGAAVACGIAAAAVLAAIVFLPRTDSTARPGASSATSRQGGQRSGTTSLQQAILTAAGAVSGDIMYIDVTSSGMPAGSSPDVQFWLWPARAAVGQRVHLVMAEAGLRTEMTFTQTAHFPPRIIATTALRIDPAARTWTTYSGMPVPGIPLTSSLYLLDKQFMLENFVNRSKVISSHADVDGQPAIEVSYPGASGLLLWVNAQTYLPLRMDKTPYLNQYPSSVQQHDFQFLPPTAANLAKVTVTVPPSYKRVAG